MSFQTFPIKHKARPACESCLEGEYRTKHVRDRAPRSQWRIPGGWVLNAPVVIEYVCDSCLARLRAAVA